MTLREQFDVKAPILVSSIGEAFDRCNAAHDSLVNIVNTLIHKIDPILSSENSEDPVKEVPASSDPSVSQVRDRIHFIVRAMNELSVSIEKVITRVEV